MAKDTGLVINWVHERFIKAYSPPFQETEGCIVGLPTDFPFKRESSEPLELTGSNLGIINNANPPGRKIINPLKFGTDYSPGPSAEILV